jgi:Flp pilus assembly protein TadB
MANSSTDDILKKYGRMIDEKQSSSLLSQQGSYNSSFSQEFQVFKTDMMPQFSKYERWCNTIGASLKLKLAQKDQDRIQKDIDSAHLQTTPSNVVSLAMLSFIIVFIASLIITVAIYLFTGNFSILLIFLSFITAAFLFYYFYTMPARLANQWRLKAGSQMVPCILYTVIYMKHTSNLERAVRFASQHLQPPLALDLGKVFWDVETGRYSTIKESLDNYLESWRGTSSEFVESFNLIESSLFEPSEARRIQILERALQVILDGVYDKMLKYTHDVKAPLTNLYMLGIVLPTLALALIPLASALMGGLIKWYVVVVLFNLIVPFIVFYMTSQVMNQRPGGYGESSILEYSPLYSEYTSRKPYVKAAMISIPLFLIGIIPFLFHYTPIPSLLGLKADYSFTDLGFSVLGDIKFFDFIVKGNTTVGPMGPIALLFSLFIPLSIFLFFSIAYFGRTKEIIKSRDYTKILEKEFNNSLFQLGNRIGDGTPAELAFGKVSESARGTVTENFFKMVNANIQSLGMSLEKAIFDTKRGAIITYPSNLISTSMHVLIESVKKGLAVAAQSLMSISDYVKNVNKINDRLRDLLADILSDMKSNMTFLAPLLAGIVVGLASMITLILGKLTAVINTATLSGQASNYGTIATITDLFKVENMIPPYLLQICVGIYIIEITFILTKTLVTVDAGEDKLKETNEIAKNLLSAGWLYIIVSFLSILLLSIIASVALSGLITG